MIEVTDREREMLALLNRPTPTPERIVHLAGNLGECRTITEMDLAMRYRSEMVPYEFDCGRAVDMPRHQHEYIRHIKERGYSREIPVCGKVGYSELAMHCRITEKVGVVALVRQDRDNYAFVVMTDGTITEGCFGVRSDGTFYLA